MKSFTMKQKIRTIIRRRLSFAEGLLKPVYSKFYLLLHKEEKEQRIHLGEIETDKPVYIIRINNRHGGLFSLFDSVLSHINYCEKKDWIPVVDLKNYPNNYLLDEEIGHINVWDIFFKQPSSVCGDGLSLEEAYHCKNAILSCSRPTLPGSNLSASTIDNVIEFARYSFLYNKYIRLNDRVMSELDRYTQKYIGNARVLGVFLRGTDYILSRPYGHPIQPTIEEVIDLVREKRNEWKIDKIYLSTEDATYVRRFCAEFPGRVIVFDRKYISVDETTKSSTVFEQINKSVIDSNYSLRDVGSDYFYSSLLLTRCSSVILSRTGITPFLLFDNKYENYYVWDKGLYGINEKRR